MTDYGHPITFGLSLIPSVGELGRNLELAQAGDKAGLEYLAVQDHAYNPEFLDAWTLITYLAARTEKIAFVPDVADLQLRPPTMLAKAAASLSVLSGGRIVLGVGGGATADGIAGMGGPRRSPAEMISFTEEALHVMRQALGGDAVQLLSEQHRIEGYEAGPVPPAPVPLWLGSNGPRMLAVTGRASDGWVSPLNSYAPPGSIPARQRLIDDAARSAGRDPADVRRIYNVVGAIDAQTSRSAFSGSADAWVDALADWAVDLGFDTFIFWPTTSPLEQLERFVSVVVPGVRERVSERRAATGTVPVIVARTGGSPVVG
jgi:alkanesulfonate monooxygenase SsuD/methylene tetrahydromethanopterin reductase-like flavin-dependent oxidoreductase (luciferase family)